MHIKKIKKAANEKGIEAEIRAVAEKI